MKETPAYTISTRGVVISCILAAAIVIAIGFAISLTKPPTAHATSFDSHGFDYFALQEATSAKDAEHANLIREEARESASRAQRIAVETQAAENGGQAAAPQNRISTDLFEFDLPEYWSDRVSVTYNEDGGVSVYANNFPEASLVTLKITEASDSVAEDSADTAMVFGKDLGGGKHIELWMTNFAWVVFDVNRPEASPEGWQADLLDQPVASELVDLQTLGTVPVEKIIQPAKADGSQFETQIDWENAVNEIVPTIVVK